MIVLHPQPHPLAVSKANTSHLDIRKCYTVAIKYFIFFCLIPLNIGDRFYSKPLSLLPESSREEPFTAIVLHSLSSGLFVCKLSASGLVSHLGFATSNLRSSKVFFLRSTTNPWQSHVRVSKHLLV